MNTFTIHFKNADGENKSVDLTLDIHSVLTVKEWFEDKFEIRARSIKKH